MALLKANLLVKSTESAVRLLVDGEDRGSLGTGIFRDLPAGKHLLELVGADLYWNQEVELAPEATTTVQASVQTVGRLEINAPAEASISLSGPGGQRSLRGTVGLERLPVGNYQLLATGPGYAESRTSLDIRKGQTARWTAWSTGQIEFWVSPSDAQYQIEGGGSGAASGTIAGIAPGATKLTISAPGYREAIVELSIAAGRTARAETSLAMFAPGAIILPKLGSEVALVVNGLVVHAESLPDGRAKYEGIPTGKPLEISYLVSLSNMPELELTMVSLSDGQTLELPLPAGRFTLPWLAEGAVVYIGGAAMETESGSGQSAYRSRLLPAGSYEVEVSSSRPYAGRVEIRKDAELELPGYRTSLLSSMESERGKAQKSLASKKAKNGWGWASLVTGLVGAGGSVASYFLGQSAMEDYLAAETTADATASRRSTELYGSLLNGSLVAAGIGLGLSPLLFFTGPKPDALQRSIDSLDEQIKALQP
jgi:hypothetical protein